MSERTPSFNDFSASRIRSSSSATTSHLLSHSTHLQRSSNTLGKETETFYSHPPSFHATSSVESSPTFSTIHPLDGSLWQSDTHHHAMGLHGQDAITRMLRVRARGSVLSRGTILKRDHFVGGVVVESYLIASLSRSQQ